MTFNRKTILKGMMVKYIYWKIINRLKIIEKYIYNSKSINFNSRILVRLLYIDSNYYNCNLKQTLNNTILKYE